MLAGLWLTDQTELNRGNLWIWPGTHLRFGEYLAEHGADALTRLDEMNPGPYPKVDLGDPIQASGAAGSVLFAHYLLAHNIGGHDGPTTAARRSTTASTPPDTEIAGVTQSPTPSPNSGPGDLDQHRQVVGGLRPGRRG